MATIGVTRGLGDHDLKVFSSNIHIKPFLSCFPEVSPRALVMAGADWGAQRVLRAPGGVGVSMSLLSPLHPAPLFPRSGCTTSHSMNTAPMTSWSWAPMGSGMSPMTRKWPAW